MTITERIDAITALPPERLAPVLDAPRSVKIELTGRCNFACAFCARSKMLREQKDMDRDLFERLLLEMRGAGVEEIGLFYLGESFLVPWLPDAIRFAKHTARYPYVFLTSNGSLCAADKVADCIAAGLDSLKFSLNYADHQQFTEIARVKPKLFDAMLDNIRAAHEVREQIHRDTGHRCGLYGSFIAYDGEQGERMRNLVEELRPYLDEIYALPLYSHGGFQTEEERSRGWTPTAGNRGRLDALRDPLPCWSVSCEGHITHEGKLSACCFDHSSGWEMGDLNRQTFMEAWNSEAFQELRTAHLSGDVSGTPCERCVADA